MKSFLLIYICAITSFKISFVNSQDPCLVSQNITGEDERSPNFTLDPSVGLAFSDDRLTKGWFRIMNDAGGDMPTEAPGTFKCGTWYPIWLNGAPPDTIGDMATVPVCLQTFSSTCANTWDIQIKRCAGPYFVYELTPSPVIDSGYCFGASGPCPAGTSSYSGYTPGCSTEFPRDVFRPEVTVDRRNGTKNITIGVTKHLNVEPVFICSFLDPGNNLFYDIHWYINENKVKTVKSKRFADLEQTILRPRHWEAAYDMNMIVKCSVRARTSADSIPGYHYYSAPFVAGIVPDAFVYEVDEGQTVNITLRATVPTGCNAQRLILNCKETFKLSYPNEYSCRNKDNWGPIIQESCGTDVSAHTWYENHTLIVHGNIDNTYNYNSVRYASVRLTKANSNTDPSKAWDRVNIPDITIRIKDKDPSLAGRTCYSYTDPNFNTFDRKSYSAQITGEYVFYRHKREPFWVHILTSACYYGSCNVGIAIRSHDSLFVVRTVDECLNPIQFDGTDHDFTATITSRTYPMIHLRDCDDRNMNIKRKGKEFTVTLPSGTEIFFRIKFDASWIHNLLVVNNINIKPSLLDIAQTEGLCGSLNFNISDEYQQRDTENLVSKDQFVTSWFISNSSDESLFVSSPKFTNNRFFYKPYCVCGEETTSNNPNTNHVHCNLTQPMEECYNTITTNGEFLYSSCSERTKRDTRYTRDTETSDEVFDISPLRYSPDFQEKYIPPVAEWKFGWTEEQARETCIQAFDNVTALETCKEYANLNTDVYIPSCMTDIKETGGTSLLQGTILTMFSICLSEVSRNETLLFTPSNNSTNGTLESTETSDAGFRSMLDAIKSQLCDNNCSQNGICDKGTCVCEEGFIGEDCSYLRSSPPSGLTIPSGGKCGTRSRNCERTLLNGIFESTEVWCKLVYFQVVNNEKQSSLSPVIEKAEYKSFSAVSCPLPTSSERRRKRSITSKFADGYDISLSNDGTNFGDEATILIYDEDCYSCNVTSLTCTLLSSCSLTTTETSGVSGSDVTDSTTSSTKMLQTTTTQPPQSSETTLNVEPTDDSVGMIPIISGIVAGICLLVAIALIVYCKGKPPKSTQNNIQPDFEGPNVAPSMTQMHPKGEFQKEHSSLDVQWLDSRPRTPEHLFVATDYKF